MSRKLIQTVAEAISKQADHCEYSETKLQHYINARSFDKYSLRHHPPTCCFYVVPEDAKWLTLLLSDWLQSVRPRSSVLSENMTCFWGSRPRPGERLPAWTEGGSGARCTTCSEWRTTWSWMEVHVLCVTRNTWSDNKDFQCQDWRECKYCEIVQSMNNKQKTKHDLAHF